MPAEPEVANVHLRYNSTINSMKRRYVILFGLSLLITIGLLSKVYTGIGASWVNDYSGDIVYEIFWCLFFFWFFPQPQNILLIPLLVFIMTSVIEITQLWQGNILQAIRRTIIGKLLLGTTFSWWDFPHYLLGCILGVLLLYFINKTFSN